MTDNFPETKNHDYNQSAVLVTRKENGSDQTLLDMVNYRFKNSIYFLINRIAS